MMPVLSGCPYQVSSLEKSHRHVIYLIYSIKEQGRRRVGTMTVAKSQGHETCRVGGRKFIKGLQTKVSHTVSNDLRWNGHIHNICNRANKMLGLLRRKLNNCSHDVKLAAYDGLVKPILEYARCAWDPHTEYLVHELEKSSTTRCEIYHV